MVRWVPSIVSPWCQERRQISLRLIAIFFFRSGFISFSCFFILVFFIQLFFHSVVFSFNCFFVLLFFRSVGFSFCCYFVLLFYRSIVFSFSCFFCSVVFSCCCIIVLVRFHWAVFSFWFIGSRASAVNSLWSFPPRVFSILGQQSLPDAMLST